MGDPEALCVESAFPTLLQMEKEHGSILRALLHRAKQRRSSGEPRKLRTIYSFTKGIQTLPDSLVEKIGDAIQTHHPITSIQQEDEAWMIENQRFSEIILTLPAHAQTKLDTPFDLSFLASIRYPAVTSLSLLYRRDQLTHLKWVRQPYPPARSVLSWRTLSQFYFSGSCTRWIRLTHRFCGRRPHTRTSSSS